MNNAAVPAKATHDLLTLEEFLERNFEGPTDLERGRVVQNPMPGFKHGRVCLNVARILDDFVRRAGIGRVICNDTHLLIERDPDTVRSMDVAFISYARLPAETEPEDALEIPPELIIEVRSPSDRWVQVLAKVLDYLAIGATAVAVLDPKTLSVTVFRSEDRQETFAEADTLTLPDVLPGFAVPVRQLFG